MVVGKEEWVKISFFLRMREMVTCSEAQVKASDEIEDDYVVERRDRGDGSHESGRDAIKGIGVGIREQQQGGQFYK